MRIAELGACSSVAATVQPRLNASRPITFAREGLKVSGHSVQSPRLDFANGDHTLAIIADCGIDVRW
jgi:hypothetical protein